MGGTERAAGMPHVATSHTRSVCFQQTARMRRIKKANLGVFLRSLSYFAHSARNGVNLGCETNEMTQASADFPSIAGVWAYPSHFAGYEDYMVINEATGRIVTASLIAMPPVKYHFSPHWFRRIAPCKIESRLHPAGPWTAHEFRFENEQIVWPAAAKTFLLRRPDSKETPDWLSTKVTEAHVKMDEAEKSVSSAS